MCTICGEEQRRERSFFPWLNVTFLRKVFGSKVSLFDSAEGPPVFLSCPSLPRSSLRDSNFCHTLTHIAKVTFVGIGAERMQLARRIQEDTAIWLWHTCVASFSSMLLHTYVKNVNYSYRAKHISKEMLNLTLSRWKITECRVVCAVT